jgi:hypothetical protein
METDPLDSTKTALYVGGTTGNDTILVQRAATAGQYTVTLGTTLQAGTYRPTGHIIVYGDGGSDVIRLLSNSYGSVTVPAFLFAEDKSGQATTIDASGSTANNVLVAGAGNDKLLDGKGYNILIGGPGIDYFNTTGGHTQQETTTQGDLIIADSTVYNSNITALNFLMAEWSGTGSLATKKARPNGTNTTGANIGYYLTSSTVHNDGSTSDILIYNLSRDHVIERQKGLQP